MIKFKGAYKWFDNILKSRNTVFYRYKKIYRY